MKTNRTLLIFVLSLIVLGGISEFGWWALKTADAQTRPPSSSLLPRQRWEYCTVNTVTPGTGGWKAQISYGARTENVDSDISGISTLNRLGEGGWELVSAVHEKGNSVEYFLKRPIR